MTPKNDIFQSVNSMKSNKTENVAKRISSKNGTYSTTRGSLARHIASKPSMREGSISTHIFSYLKKRKNPASITEIADYVFSNRDTTTDNKSVVRYSVKRVLAQLTNWNKIRMSKDKQDTNNVMFSIYR